MNDEAKDVIIYALKPTDFVLLVLCFILALYVVPRRAYKWYNNSQKRAHEQ